MRCWLQLFNSIIMFDKLIKDNFKDKTEIKKQKQEESKRVFQGSIMPKKGHTLFEICLKRKTIKKAEFDSKEVVNWKDAVNGLISTKKEITKKEGCIYISALNEKNVRKILERDFQIKL